MPEAHSFAVAFDRDEDLVGGLRPYVGAWIRVPGVDPVADVGVQRADGFVGTALELLVVSSPNHRSTLIVEIKKLDPETATDPVAILTQLWSRSSPPLAAART